MFKKVARLNIVLVSRGWGISRSPADYWVWGAFASGGLEAEIRMAAFCT